MAKRFRLMKSTWYPRPHNMKHSWSYNLESVAGDWTSYPIIMHDEGLGAPSTYESHPSHPSFVETAAPNCFPESTISNLFVELTLFMTKIALETDKLHMVNMAFMPIYLAFKEDYEAIDELSSVEIQDVLMYEKETTDRQGHPLWSVDKMTARFSGSNLLDALVPGLTTTQQIEAVDFIPENFYDALQFMTISKKLRNAVGGLKHVILTRQRPIRKFRIGLNSKVKRMNPFASCSILIGAPVIDTHEQIPIGADTSAAQHVGAKIDVRYLEWNEHFNHSRV